MSSDQMVVETFHNAYLTLLRNAAKNRDLVELERLGKELVTIAHSGKECANIAANLVNYARTCYRNIAATTPRATVKPATVKPSQPITNVPPKPKNGKYTLVHAHWRKV